MNLRFALEAPVRSPTIVFDIGGTWFRSAIVEPDGEISDIRRQPAISYVSHPTESAKWLHDAFVRYVTEEVTLRMCERSDIASRVSISLGAALDQRTGVVWNAGPLWGDHGDAFDLRAALHSAMPRIDWTVVNDVTATLLSIVRHRQESLKGTLVYVTISTGIAARSWSSSLNGIPLDGLTGLQGEIGHLPVTCSFRGAVLHGRCGCGGSNHLNAFASGRGLEFLLQAIGNSYPDVASKLGDAKSGSAIRGFTEALGRECPIAAEILQAAVDPLARILLTALTMDPHISRIFFGGGVIDGVGHSLWLKVLLEKLRGYGPYQISDRSPAFLDHLLEVVDTRDAGLSGAACAAWSRIQEERVQ
jgi:predicted NBD/HSP70 family sugar kinase